MKKPLGLAGRLIFSFVALVLISQLLNYRSTSELRYAAIQERELDKVETVAREIEPRLKREAAWISSVAKLLQRDVSKSIQLSKKERFDSIAETMALSYQQANVSTLEVTDDQGIVVYRAHDPERHADLDSSWGIEEALSGNEGLVSVRERKATLIKAIEPLRLGGKVIGTLSAGRRIDETFMNGLSREVGAELSLVARSGEVVISSVHGKTEPEQKAIADAFQQKIPVFRNNDVSRTTLVYLPVLIVDEAWVVMAELDSSSAYALLDRINKKAVLFTLLVTLVVTLLTYVILRRALRPLRVIRARAEQTIYEMHGKRISTESQDDLDSLISALDTLTNRLTDSNRTLIEQQADLRIAAAAFESQEAMMIADANLNVVRVNKAFTRITGYSSEELIGQQPKVSNFRRHNDDFYRNKWKLVDQIGSWQGEVWDQRKNGEAYPKWLTISAITNETGAVTHYVLAHLDITEQKEAEQKIHKLAFFDPLTQLPNRKLLMDRLNHAMAGGTLRGGFGAVLFIDLDYFKVLNDTMGHDNGDMLLQQVAQRLIDCVNGEDTVARIGGDEFVVVLCNLSTDFEQAARQAEEAGLKILAALNDTFQLDDIEHRSSASIGATLFLGQQTAIGELLKQADLAMYKSKDSGRNSLHFFDPSMQTAVMNRTALEHDLRSAISAKQFVVHYQPQITHDGGVTGAEALVRWQHTERGIVSPAEFIPLAEETGLILPLGNWVLEVVCRKLAEWSSEPDLAVLTVAVNVSAMQLRQPDFVKRVQDILSSTGANPLNLKLELTESMLAENVEDVIQKMLELRAMGVSFSLDDFGTGYSSLSYLKRLPLEQLKIDQSFVRDVLVDANDASIAKAIVTLAQSLGLGVIAEGVETLAQQEFLYEAGCYVYQGYHFSKPLPTDRFEAFVMRNSIHANDRAYANPMADTRDPREDIIAVTTPITQEA